MDIALVEKLIELLQGSTAAELSVTVAGTSVHIKRGLIIEQESEPMADALDQEAVEHAAPEETASAREEITAGMVGIFRQEQYVTVGVPVQPGQVLGLIESMKLMNEVTSKTAGVVEEMFVEDGSPVEYGQVLMTIAEHSGDAQH